MTTDIREQATKAAREYEPNAEWPTGVDSLDAEIREGFEAGYLAGYEVAKAEAGIIATPKRVRRAACPFDADDLDEERHGKL